MERSDIGVFFPMRNDVGVFFPKVGVWWLHATSGRFPLHPSRYDLIPNTRYFKYLGRIGE